MKLYLMKIRIMTFRYNNTKQYDISIMTFSMTTCSKMSFCIMTISIHSA